MQAKTGFCLYLATVPSINAKNLRSAKKNNECRKTGFKAGEHTFMAVSKQRYLRLTQKNLRHAKKRMANTVKTV